MIEKLETVLTDLRKQKPLILCISNVVTMEFVANSLLAVGAAPMMSACEDELQELLKIAAALYINIGTLDHHFIQLSKKAIHLANKDHKPIVLDPVGAGASRLRTETSKDILTYSQFIRGNSSEIIALAEQEQEQEQATYGVEATHASVEAEEIAARISRENNSIVIVSGPVDFITNGEKSVKVPFGSQQMQWVTGMGCCMTAMIAAFQSVMPDPFDAGVLAAYYFSLCGEIVSQKHQRPGLFKIAFLDQLHCPDFKLMRELYDKRR